MVEPAERKEVVDEVLSKGRHSECRVCELLGISRSAYTYESQREAKDNELKEQLLKQAECHPRYGYLMLHGVLKNMGLVVNKKRTYRLYTQAGLQLRVKKRKKLNRLRCVQPPPTAVNQRWSMDFVHDQLSNGRRFRSLNIVDNFSRECVGQVVDISIGGERVADFLSQLIKSRGKPNSIVCDNGPEFTCSAMFRWQRDTKVKLASLVRLYRTWQANTECFCREF